MTDKSTVTKMFPMALVLFGKTFKYQTNAVFELKGESLALISLIGTCTSTKISIDFLPLIKSDEGIERHVLNCLQENWENLDTSKFYVDDLRTKRIKRRSQPTKK